MNVVERMETIEKCQKCDSTNIDVCNDGGEYIETECRDCGWISKDFPLTDALTFMDEVLDKEDS